MKELHLGCYGIIISHNEGDKSGAAIVSEMKEPETSEDNLFNSAVDALESIILAHFCAGIDVCSPAYLEGIETACQALGNNIDVNPESSNSPFSLKDEGISKRGDITGHIDNSLGFGIALHFNGYSDYCSKDSIGTPIYIESFEGDLRAIIYADINQEDPTHIISLENSKNSNRLAE
jgi:hypothetical protein